MRLPISGCQLTVSLSKCDWLWTLSVAIWMKCVGGDLNGSEVLFWELNISVSCPLLC